MDHYETRDKDWRREGAGFVRNVTSGKAKPWQYLLIGAVFGWIFL